MFTGRHQEPELMPLWKLKFESCVGCHTIRFMTFSIGI